MDPRLLAGIVAVVIVITGIADSVPAMSQGTSTCEAPISSFRRCVLRDGDWQHRVYIGNEVETATALILLLAVRDGRIVNRQTADSSGKVPGLPTIDVDRIFQVTGPRGENRFGYQYVLRTASRTDSLAGNELFINLRDGQVEILGIGFWIS